MTCQKAVAFLKSLGVTIAHQRDIKSNPLSFAEVKALAAKLGGAQALFSKRAIKFRTMGLSEKVLSDADLLRLMAEEYTFIKRPVIVVGSKSIAGFSEKSYLQLLA